MTNLIKADFNGTQVLFQNDAYLHATAIATRFGKKAKDYLKTERTQEYINALIKLNNSKRTKIPFEENQLVTVKKGSPANGGGTWLHPKLAIDFARWLSAEFAVWCDEQIEKILYKQFEQPKLDNLSSVESRVPLKDAVNRLVATKKVPYNVAWKMVHQREGVSKANELTEAQVQDALQYVHELTLSNVIEGEWLPRKETPKLAELPDGHANIPFNLQKNADYMVRVRDGKANRKQLLYCLNPQDEKQNWWLEA